MTITDADMTVYDFGERKIWPKPELKTPYQVLDHYSSLMRSLDGLGNLVNVSSGRQDHLVQSLDILASSLREALFKSMVLRESITGFQTRELAREAEDKQHG